MTAADLIPLLWLVGIISGACALVVLCDYFGADPSPRGMFGDPDYMAPWTNAEREPGEFR